MIKTIGNYGISTIEAIQVFNSLGEAIATLEQQVESQDISSTEATEMFSLANNIISARSFEKTNIELAPGKVYDLPKNHNCRNCGAPVKSCICEYCGTVY